MSYDCHSPKMFTGPMPEPDPLRRLSGHPASEPLPEIPAGLIAPDKWGAIVNNHFTAWVGPWGVSFTPNLTPDMATGLGSWTEEVFVTRFARASIRARAATSCPRCPGPSIAT